MKIDLNRIYSFPEGTVIIPHKGRFMAVAPKSANWIVMQNGRQKEIFSWLGQGLSISEVIEKNGSHYDDVVDVITQLEARRFCTKNPVSNIDRARSLHLYLTNKCNLRCPHCYMFSGDPNGDELSTEEIKKLISEYRTIAHGKKITISGGEPTVRDDFEDIVDYAHGMGLEIKLLTNGVLLNRETASRISKYVSSVQISVDGFSEQSNSPIRGRGSFGKSLECVDCFVGCGVETSVAVTPPHLHLEHHIDEYAEFAKGLRNKYRGKKFFIKFTAELSDGRSVRLSVADSRAYNDNVKKIQQKIYDEDIDLIEFLQTMQDDVVLENCMYGAFAVASNGDVFLCPEISKLKPVANVRKDDFSDILKTARVAERMTSVDRISPCSDCEIRMICGGGCRIKEIAGLPNAASVSDLENLSLSRRCDPKIKEGFYDLMISSNEYLYVPL